ncbi:MAG: hypothetical protein KGJ10_03765 [Acidobacteriota bacterium]|nr:hypothetical protein [Acidobacteriota bacterium]MDE3043926.1 hypothetical protein [Acidobacteriota bacterium]MDE3106789.1 hypothetical protein [Acidobacteriota bacterium]
MSDLEALRALMEADRWIERVVGQRSHLPELSELASVEEELRAMAQQLRAGDEVLAPLRAAADEAARESERLRSRQDTLRAKLDASTANARELTALQHELDSVGTMLRASEDHELDLMSELEPLESTRADLTANAQPLAARRGELRATIDALQATLDEELRALRDDREVRASALRRELRVLYDAALARAGGSGAAQVIEGRCDGCRLALAPLDLDHWRQRAHDLTFACPECGRVLLP